MVAKLERRIFEAIQRDYDETGLECAILEPSDTIPFETLITVFDKIGQNNRIVRLENNFFPRSADRDDVLLLQSISVLVQKVIPYHQPELLRFFAQINYTLPIGSFGFLENGQMAYFKHNAMIMVSYDFDDCVKQIDAQIGLIFHLHQIYFDAIEAVATGRYTAEDAIKSIKHPEISRS